MKVNEMKIIEIWESEYYRHFQIQVFNDQADDDYVVCLVGLPEDKIHPNKMMHSGFEHHFGADLLEAYQNAVKNIIQDAGYEVV